MKIETKFSIGDQVYFLNAVTAKVVTSIIRGVKMELLPYWNDGVPEPANVEITYLCNDELNAKVHIKVSEEKAFTSKEDLLKSL